MKPEFTVSQVIRYALTGGVAALAYMLHCADLNTLLAGSVDAARISVSLGVIVLLGVLIQSLHRSLQYPVIRRLIYLLFRKFGPTNARDRKLSVTELATNHDHARWKRRGSESNAAQDSLDHWADQIHFLYASGLAVFIALIASRFLLPCPGPLGITSRALSFMATIFYVAALIHDYRHTCAQAVAPELVDSHGVSQK